jgi:hypothetical protein
MDMAAPSQPRAAAHQERGKGEGEDREADEGDIEHERLSAYPGRRCRPWAVSDAQLRDIASIA